MNKYYTKQWDCSGDAKKGWVGDTMQCGWWGLGVGESPMHIDLSFLFICPPLPTQSYWVGVLLIRPCQCLLLIFLSPPHLANQKKKKMKNKNLMPFVYASFWVGVTACKLRWGWGDLWSNFFFFPTVSFGVVFFQYLSNISKTIYIYIYNDYYYSLSFSFFLSKFSLSTFKIPYPYLLLICFLIVFSSNCILTLSFPLTKPSFLSFFLWYI